MKRFLALGSSLATVLLAGCGADPTSSEPTSAAAALELSSHGADSVASARAGNGFIVDVAEGAEGAVDAWISAHGARGRAFRFVSARAVDVASAADAAALAAVPGVLGVYPNRVVTSGAKPGTGGGGSAAQVLPASIARVRAPEAWGLSTGAGVGIAVVDTGIDLAHPDLAHPAPCFTAYTSCDDGNGHGTHVAGTAAALDNTTGVIGVAPGAVPYAVRVLDSSGSGTDETIINGLEWVLANAGSVVPPIRVVNMSLGRPGSVDDDPVLHTAVQNLVAAGISVVVAAGNDAQLEISQQIPSGYPEVLAVASTTAVAGRAPTKGACAGLSIGADTASSFTSDGAGVAVSAPGEESEGVSNGCMLQSTGILSLARGGGTTRMSGTSMASPAVAGVAALLVAADGSLQASDVRARLGATAACVGSAPKNSPTSSYTFDGTREGVVNALAALANAPSACP